MIADYKSKKLTTNRLFETNNDRVYFLKLKKNEGKSVIGLLNEKFINILIALLKRLIFALNVNH